MHDIDMISTDILYNILHILYWQLHIEVNCHYQLLLLYICI